MIIEGFEVEKKDDMYFPKIKYAPNDLCIKVREKISRLDGSIVYASYSNYYFWGEGRHSPYHPTDPYFASTEEDAVEAMIIMYKKLMDEHDNNPDKFCWEPVYYLNAFNQHEFCEKRGYCQEFKKQLDEKGWGWAHNSYSHLILGNGKITKREEFSNRKEKT
jgi:hypothetical protein